tara:strand:+ start:2443 stop:4149 length:1707 start_codon:yes stop_codon:yes gene_type:complete
MKKTNALLFLIYLSIKTVAFSQDPIISVWYIGTRISGGGPYNHYIELHNPTNEIIDLSQYALIKGHGQTGATGIGWGSTLDNSGVSFNRLPQHLLFPGASYGISRDVSHESLQNFADLVLEDECVLSISGDDAVGLFKGEGGMDDVLAANDSIPLDAVGNPKEDPGQSWQVSGQTGPTNSTGTSYYGVTRFAILLRKPDVCFGNAGDWNSSRGCVTDSCNNTITEQAQTSYEQSEWDVFACHYPDEDGNQGPGYEPVNPDCAEDVNTMTTYSSNCDLQNNENPVADGGPDQSVGFAELVTLDGSSSTDSDGSIQSYQWAQLSGTTVTLSNQDEPTTTFISPGSASILIFSLTVADDGGGMDTDTVVVTVLNTNLAPIADAGPDQSVGFAELVILDGSASVDTDGNIETYQWTQISGSVVELSSPDEQVTTFTSPENQNILLFELVVVDNFGDSSMDTVSVVVLDNTASTENHKITPKTFEALGNYPNPFNPITKISFFLGVPNLVTIKIYNIFGKEQWSSRKKILSAGRHSFTWDGTSQNKKTVGTGIYYYTIAAGSRVLSGKMLLVK